MRWLSNILAGVLGCMACLWFNLAGADQRDERLPDLFAALADAHERSEASVLEQRIWQIWLESGSDTLDLLMQRSIIAMQQNRFGDSLELLNTIIELKPDFAEAWNKRATVFYLIGQYSDSINDVAETLKLEPRHFGALSGLGLIYDAQGNYRKALSALEKAIAVHPHLANAKQQIERLRELTEGQKI